MMLPLLNPLKSTAVLLAFLLITIISSNKWSLANGLAFKVKPLILQKNPLNNKDEQQYREVRECNFMGRRKWFQSSAVLSPMLLLTPHKAVAATVGQNQAVYDLQFYLRDLIQGNNIQGNLPASKPPTPPKPPRTLIGPLVPLLLNNDCTSSCVPAQELSILLSSGSSPLITTTANVISNTMMMYRINAIKAGYGSFHQWLSEDVSDEYYFDLTSYALWRAAASLLPTTASRDIFARNVGRTLYKEMKRMPIIFAVEEEGGGNYGTTLKNIPPASITTSQLSNAILPKLYSILNAFESAQFISAYRVTRDESYSAADDDPLFDDDDDQDYYKKENSLNILVSLYNPTTIQAALQITGEGSRFIPDFVGCTIAAMLEDAVQASTVTYESYFVDPVYRPNPKDFFPNEQLLQFTFLKKR